MIGGMIGGNREVPVPKVTNTNATIVTDANGQYTLAGLAPGAESVLFSHLGYVEATRKITLEGRETNVDVQLTAKEQ
jgi:hypothetical protein